MHKAKGSSSNRASLGRILKRGSPVKSSNDIQNIVENAVYKTLTELSLDLSEYVPKQRYSGTISFLLGIIATIIVGLSTAYSHDVSVFGIFIIPSQIIYRFYQIIALAAFITIVVLLCVRKKKKRKICNNTTLAENISRNCDFSGIVFIQNTQRILHATTTQSSELTKHT